MEARYHLTSRRQEKGESRDPPPQEPLRIPRVLSTHSGNHSPGQEGVEPGLGARVQHALGGKQMIRPGTIRADGKGDSNGRATLEWQGSRVWGSVLQWLRPLIRQKSWAAGVQKALGLHSE